MIIRKSRTIQSSIVKQYAEVMLRPRAHVTARAQADNNNTNEYLQ